MGKLLMLSKSRDILRREAEAVVGDGGGRASLLGRAVLRRRHGVAAMLQSLISARHLADAYNQLHRRNKCLHWKMAARPSSRPLTAARGCTDEALENSKKIFGLVLPRACPGAYILVNARFLAMILSLQHLRLRVQESIPIFVFQQVPREVTQVPRSCELRFETQGSPCQISQIGEFLNDAPLKQSTAAASAGQRSCLN